MGRCQFCGTLLGIRRNDNKNDIGQVCYTCGSTQIDVMGEFGDCHENRWVQRQKDLNSGGGKPLEKLVRKPHVFVRKVA